MKKVKLTRNRYALVDDVNFERVSKIKWHFVPSETGPGYAIANEYMNGWQQKSGSIHMHHFVMGVGKEKIIDHIDGDTLDNRMQNLRIVTASQNSMNRDRNINNTTGYKGVSRRKFDSKIYYSAVIGINRKRKHLGLYQNPEDAAFAYNLASKKYHGEHGRPNCLNKKYKPTEHAFKKYAKHGLIEHETNNYNSQ